MLKFYFALFTLILNSGCSTLFYQPSTQDFYNPAQLNLTYEDVNFSATDKTALHGWYFPARLKKGETARGTVVQFHGNAENISTHFASLAWLSEVGFNFFTFDYRGYGTSAGDPSQEGVNMDALAAIDYIQKRIPSKEKSKDIVLYGQSLGGAVLMRALHDIKDRTRIRAVVIDSSFYSYKAIARAKLAQSWITFIFQPLAWVLISDEYSPESWISEISPIPMVIIHGDKDRVVPQSFGREIYNLAREPKFFWPVQDGYHIDSMVRHNGKYRKMLIDYLDSLI